MHKKPWNADETQAPLTLWTSHSAAKVAAAMHVSGSAIRAKVKRLRDAGLAL